MRLGDLDALKPKIDKFIGYLDEDMIERIKVVIDNTPTIIWCSETSNGLPLMDLRPRPKGEWVYTDKEDKEKGYGGYCSVCKCDMPIGINDWKQEYYESNFCPNCGAEMHKGGAK